MQVAEALARLAAAWQAGGAAWARALRPGQPAPALRKLLKPWSAAPPPALLALHGWSDGLAEGHELLPGARWFSAEQALADRQRRLVLAEQIARRSGISPDALWSPRWLPLMPAAPELGEGSCWFIALPARGQREAALWFKDREDEPVPAYDSVAALALTAASCIESKAWKRQRTGLLVADENQAAALFRQHNPRTAGVASTAAAGEPWAPLLQTLATGDGRARGAAAALLIKRRDAQALPGLLELLSNADPGVRVLALRVLEALRDPRALPALVGALDDAQPLVRSHAAMALAALGDRQAVAPLVAAFERCPPLEAVALARALAQLSGDAAIQRLTPWLAAGQPAPLRYTALATLGPLAADPRLTPLLQPLLHDADPQVRAAAASALAGLQRPRRG